MTMEADLAGRAAHAATDPATVPSSEQRDLDNAGAFRAEMRVATTERDGRSVFHFHGIASTVEQPYEMYDMFGPYTEVVDRHAFDVTLAANPDVAFLLNHRGATMARTRSGTVELGVSDEGLVVDAYCNPERTDVRDLAHAIGDGDIDQMSFAFRIVRGVWSPDYSEYRILEVDLHRGDVSAVNYGANPNTSIAARAKQALAAVGELPAAVLREIAERAEQRLNANASAAPTPPTASAAPEARGTSTSYAAALLRSDLG
ncbi:HK97 family phage prohead protease [uncultured Microbacterium sp.]|uniref:HK97 family phage prohead protease n=1 Tax=uncultured Microbacterium sp. TaxID=191216 RepID=UPI0025F137E1|nr:HK97 family phage prohead protease [uncultured Microbacterium sp.]